MNRILQINSESDYSMKRVFHTFAFVCVCIGVILISNTANAEDATGSASAEIRLPVAVSEVAPLNFGAISATASADVLTLTPGGLVSSLNGAISSGSTPASFGVTGSPNSAVTISFVNGSVTNLGNNMSLNGFTHDAGVTPALAGDGSLLFAVGGDLNIGTSQAAGLYTGTYQVSVNYQ